MGCIINIDTGGTFTDGFLSWDGDNRGVKVLTTPHDLTVCFIGCLEEGAGAYGVRLEEMLRQTDVIRFSTTLGTNSIIQRSGPKLGILVSQGHAKDLYAGSDEASGLGFLVDGKMVREVTGTMNPDGTSLVEPDRESVLKAVQDLIDRGARAVVISLANSHADPSQERQIRTWVEEAFPQEYLGAPQLFLASDLSDRPGDCVRTNTALVNAYIHREMARSLYRAEEQIRKRQYGRPLLVAHSSGGCARVAKTQALHTFNSGPAGGLAGVDFLRRAYGFDKVLSADMGGTSADIAAISGAEIPFEDEPEIESLRVHLPMLSVRGIGAGGGSIARTRDGKLQVGPESAGSAPGPACFDLGGTLPTVTDADLVLGYLDPEFFLGGRMKLNRARAEAAIKTHVAEPLGVTVEAAALAIRNRIDAQIAESLRMIMAETGNGLERPEALFCFGGAGPTHAAGFAGALGVPRLITSPYASVFSAFGLSQLDLTHSYSWSPNLPLIEGDHSLLDQGLLQDQLAYLKDRAVADMRGEGFPSEKLSWRTEVCLVGRGGQNRFERPGEGLSLKALMEMAIETRQAWGGSRAEQVYLAGLTLTASASVLRYRLAPNPKSDRQASEAHKGTRPVFWAEPGSNEPKALITPVYDRDRLLCGHRIIGPALIEGVDTTCVVPPGWRYSIDHYLCGVLEEVTL